LKKEASMADQVALVTGISSGIGRSAASALAAQGFRVFGTLRSPEQQPPTGVEAVYLDVRDEASVRAAIRDVVARAGRIDLLVNNAGGTLMGAIEETDVAQAQALFDVNFFGAVRVTRAVLPHMRAQRSGRILFISSVVGFLPAPFMGFYAASKHAVEGYAESLDHEVRGFGIRVVLVEPGFMRTAIDANTAVAGEALADYASVRERVRAGLRAQVEAGDDPSLAAKAIVRAATAARPRLRYPVGKGAALLATLRSVLPAALFDRSFRKEFRLDG
jgi:NAD(P)-dependent dehydrogenase (short-subunit alcohol dehydrogenase family)